MPPMPMCSICTDRFSDTFFVPSEHFACKACTAELEENAICVGELQCNTSFYLYWYSESI